MLRSKGLLKDDVSIPNRAAGTHEDDVFCMASMNRTRNVLAKNRI